MNSFALLLPRVQDALSLGQLDGAREAFDRLRTLACTPLERRIAHDLGNAIQRALFRAYLGEV